MAKVTCYSGRICSLDAEKGLRLLTGSGGRTARRRCNGGALKRPLPRPRVKQTLNLSHLLLPLTRQMSRTTGSNLKKPKFVHSNYCHIVSETHHYCRNRKTTKFVQALILILNIGLNWALTCWWIRLHHTDRPNTGGSIVWMGLQGHALGFGSWLRCLNMVNRS